MWSSHICSSERPSNKYFFLRTQENREPMQQDVYLSCIHPCPCPRQTKFVFVYMCNAYYVCSVKFDGKESYWKQVCRLVPAACDSEVKSRRSDRGGSRTNLGPALETGQPWPPPSIGHPPVSSPRPPSPSFFSKRPALFPSDCVHGDHLWSPRGLFSTRCTRRPKTLSPQGTH